MYIMNQDENAMYDTEEFWGIISEDCKIKGLLSDGEIVLGTYQTHEKACDILMDIFIQMDNTRFQMPII